MKHTPARLWDLPSALLLTLALLAASQRLYATNWTPGLETALLLSFFGVILGLALGASKFNRGGVFWFTTGLSLTLVPLVTAWILYQKTPWLERIISLGGRLGNSVYLFVTAQPVTDTALFVVLTGSGFWIISLLAGYALTRRGDFPTAVAPTGVVLFIIQLYDSRVGDRIIILAIYAILCLLLLGRMTYVRKRITWKELRVSLSAESWTDLNLAIPAATLVLVIIAWIVPVNARPIVAVRQAWENLTRPLQQSRQDLGNAIAGLQSNENVVTSEFYGDRLALGLSASVNDSVYLSIRVPVTAQTDRYYWRVRTYDQYINNEWTSTNTLYEAFTPDLNSLLLVDAHGVSGEFLITAPQTILNVLATPSHPIWVSRPSVINFTSTTGKFIDPVMISVNSPIQVGEQYTVHANIFNPTIFQLQHAGAIYPSWVKDRYLQLPANLPDQITELARQITTDAVTPYDKATAITDYLRKAITYSTTVEPAPEGIDPLVWFLFDQRSGFCNYYATAEVIMLRSVGVPARMVAGFAQGEYQAPDKYTVHEKDAHAWPEVYFPGIGWVEFEPTVSQAPLVRLPGDESQARPPTVVPEDNGQNTPGKGNQPLEDTGTGSQPGGQPNSLVRLTLYVVILVVIIIGTAAAYMTGMFDKLLGRTRLVSHHPLPILLIATYTNLDITPPTWLARWAYYASLTPIERSFGIVYQSLRWLGHTPSPAQTPTEAAATLTASLPEVAEDIRILVLQYERAFYSPKHTDLDIARRSVDPIRRQALRKAFNQRVEAIRSAILRIFSRKPKEQ